MFGPIRRKASLGDTWRLIRGAVRVNGRPPDLEAEFAALRDRAAAPVLWLFGKTQSGKTSLVRYLTGAEDAAIGCGFRPTTRTSREYPFPTADAPILTFLDTRGVDEPGYDPAEDIAAFDPRAHLLVVTNRVTDFAHGNVRAALRKVRDANRSRPAVLVLTCLHEALLPDPHPIPYPFVVAAGKPVTPPAVTGDVPDRLTRIIAEQTKQFSGLVDLVVPVDLTKPEEGFAEPDYGGNALKRVLLGQLPAAYRETLARAADVMRELRAAHLRHAAPVITAYSSMAATAGAVPVPFLDLVLLPAVQAKMVHELGQLYGQPQTAARFLELATSLGIGLAARQAVRQVVKFIPFVGSAAGAAMAWASTYALGRAFCEYFQQVHNGHVPPPDALKRLYHAQFTAAERAWAAGESRDRR